MKKLANWYPLAKHTLLLAGVLAVAGCALWAQNDAPPAGQMRQRGFNPDREVEQLTRVLSLTADQQAQVRSLLVDQRQKMEALRKSSSSDDASSQAALPSREQVEAIRNDTNTKITALLNDDQKTKFAVWQQERRERMQQRRGQGGENPPPPAPGN